MDFLMALEIHNNISTEVNLINTPLVYCFSEGFNS